MKLSNFGMAIKLGYFFCNWRNKTDTKLYVPVVTLSNQDNTKLLQQLKSSLKRTINWNKYQSNPKTYSQNRYLTHLVDPSFQGVNRLFVLSFENEDDGTSHSTYVMIDGKNVSNRVTNSDLKTYENIINITTGQGDDYTTGCLLNYSYFKNCYEMIAIDLSKQQFLDADPRAIKQINFTANLDSVGNTTMFFIIEET